MACCTMRSWMSLLLALVATVTGVGLKASDNAAALNTPLGAYIKHQPLRWFPSPLRPVFLDVFGSQQLLSLSGWPPDGQNVIDPDDQYTVDEWPDDPLFQPVEFEDLAHYLTPDDISPDQQHRLMLELEQLTVREAGDSGSLKPVKIYLTMFSGQLRAVLIQLRRSDIHINTWLNGIVDSLLQLFIPLLLSASVKVPEEGSGLPSELMAAAGGGGDDDHNNGSAMKFFYRDFAISPSFYHLSNPAEQVIRKKLRLLGNIWKRLQQAIADGNRDLALILRDRLMVIQADMDDLLPILSLELLQEGSQFEQARNIQTLREAQQFRGWVNLLDALPASLLQHGQGPSRQRPVEKNSEQGAPDGNEGTAANSPPHQSNLKPRHPRDSQDGSGEGNSPPEKGQSDSGEVISHSRNHDNCPLCETQICLECECPACQNLQARDRATKKTSAAGHNLKETQKQNEILESVAALVPGTSAYENQSPHTDIVAIQTYEASESGLIDHASSKHTIRAVRSIKSMIKRELELHDESETFFAHLGLSPYCNFDDAWSEASAKGLLTVKSILNSLSVLQQSTLIEHLLPALNLNFESLNAFRIWTMLVEGEPPDLFFDDSVVDDDSVLSSSSSSEEEDLPPLWPVNEYREKVTPEFKPLPKKRARSVPHAVKLLKSRGPEQAEAFFREEYDVDELEEGKRAHQAIALIKYYFPNLDGSMSAGTLYHDLQFKTFYANDDSSEMELVLIAKCVPQVSTASELTARLKAIHQRAVDHTGSKMTPIMKDAGRLIQNFCRSLNVYYSSGTSLLDALAWGAGWRPIELLEEFIDQLAGTLLSEETPLLVARLRQMEEYPPDNRSPLMSQIFERKFHIRTASAIGSLLAELRRQDFNAASKDDIRKFLWSKLWKDEKEELLSVIATAGFIRQPLVVIYPARPSLFSWLYTINGFAMDADMNFTTDLDHKSLKPLLKRFSRPPLLLFRINNKWLAAIGEDMGDYSELSELCQEFYRVRGLQAGIHVHSSASVRQLPNARLMFSHSGIHSSVVLVAKEDITPEMYQLFLVLNAMHIDSREQFNFDALVEANSPVKPKAEPDSSMISTALAIRAENPLALIDISSGHAREVLSRAGARSFKGHYKSVVDKLAKAMEILNTARPDLDAVLRALADAEFVYSGFYQSPNFEEDSFNQEFDHLYQHVLAHPMVRLRQLTLSSWTDIMAGFVYVEQTATKQQAAPAEVYIKDGELELLHGQLLALNQETLLDNQQPLFRFLKLFSQALPDIEAARFLPLAVKIRELLSGEEKNLRLLQLHFNQLKAGTAPKALPDSPQTIPGETGVVTETVVATVTDTKPSKALLMQEFLAGRGYSQSALLTDQQLLELSEDLGMAPLLRFLTEKQFQQDRQQLAIAASANPSVKPELPTGEMARSIAGHTITNEQARALVPVELPGSGGNQIVYQTGTQTCLQAVPSQAMALLMKGHITPAQLAHSSRPYRKALIKQTLKNKDLQARSTLRGVILDRLESRDISRLPAIAGVKGLKALPPAAIDHPGSLRKQRKKTGNALLPVPWNTGQYEEAIPETGF